jgi:hypothetical protein
VAGIGFQGEKGTEKKVNPIVVGRVEECKRVLPARNSLIFSGGEDMLKGKII